MLRIVTVLRYVIPVALVIIFPLLLNGPVIAEDIAITSGVESAYAASQESTHEGGHQKDRSADLLDLLYRFINFTLLVVILFIVIKKTKPMDILSARREDIKQKLEDLKREKKEAEERYLDMEKQLKDFEGKRRDIIDQFRKEGLAEKERIIEDAKVKVDHIIEQSELYIQQEIQYARESLKQEVVDLATQKAKEIIAKEIDDKDQDQLVNEFIERVGKIH